MFEIDDVLQELAKKRGDFGPVMIAQGEGGVELRIIEAMRVTVVLAVAGANTGHPRAVRADFALDMRVGLESQDWHNLGIRCLGAIEKVTDEFLNNSTYSYDAQ